jgi:DNA-binding transcriptional ArsR family regulator
MDKHAVDVSALRQRSLESGIDFDALAAFSKMNQDDVRFCLFRILSELEEGQSLTVHALVDAVSERQGYPADQPNISHHLALMRMSGLVKYTRDGKENKYVLTQRYSEGWEAVRQFVEPILSGPAPESNGADH